MLYDCQGAAMGCYSVLNGIARTLLGCSG